MAELVFCCCRPLQNLLLGIPLEGPHAANFGAFACECSRLIKKERINLAHQLKRSSILDEYALLSAERQRRQHSDWRSNPNACAQITVNDRHSTVNTAGSETQRSESQRRHYGFI